MLGDGIEFPVVYTEPSFAILFFTISMGNNQGLALGITTPCSSILLTSTSTTPLSASGILHNGCCTSYPSVRMECLTAGIRLTAPPLGMNKWANQVTSFWCCIFSEDVKSDRSKLKSRACDWSVCAATTLSTESSTSITLCLGVASPSFIPLWMVISVGLTFITCRMSLRLPHQLHP